MALFKDGGFVDDPWRRLDAGEPAPGDGRIIVPLDRWTSETVWRGRNAPTGVRIVPGVKLDEVEHELARLPLIALEFLKYTDGRAYSLAQRLRGRLGFAGELRAVGDVLLDQLQLMRRCGFDAFEITHEATIAALRRGHLAGITRFYQPGLSSDEVPTGTRPWLRTGVRT